MMDQNLVDDVSKNNVRIKALMSVTNTGQGKNSNTSTQHKQNKCRQCDYASSHTSELRTHLMIHSGEKPNKCNQCDFASTYQSALRTHLKKTQWRKVPKMQQM